MPAVLGRGVLGGVRAEGKGAVAGEVLCVYISEYMRGVVTLSARTYYELWTGATEFG